MLRSFRWPRKRPSRIDLREFESSIRGQLQWVAFEQNGADLWVRVVGEVSGILHQEWKAGRLQGVKEDHAFFVECDRRTMTQADIESGRLIVVIGVAPVRPSEFQLLRVELATAI